MKILKIGQKVQPSKLLLENSPQYSGMHGKIISIRPTGWLQVRWNTGLWNIHIRQELNHWVEPEEKEQANETDNAND